jgi:hypothetical protein
MYRDPDFYSYFAAAPEWWADGRALPVGRGAFEFGFEAEFANPEPLFGFYRPVAGLPLPSEPAAAAQALRALARSLPHGDRRSLLEKFTGPDYLPATLFRDDTGNLELVLAPVKALKDFWDEVSFVNSHLSVGSLQAMVSLPREEFFADPEGALGWLNFFNELDVLERLVRGHRSEAGEPARPFLHPYLGPMTELRHQSLRKYLRENREGRLLAGEDLARVAKREQSFKFVGSTAYRPDVAGPDKVCLEVRDAHRSPDLLKERVARILYYWRVPRAPFAKFARVPAFDSGAAFAALPEAVRDFLRRECAVAIPERVRAHVKPLFSFEVFRNFAYPLRHWGPYLELLPGLSQAAISGAQEAYLAELTRSLTLSGPAARAAAQRALARFPEASGLFAAFRAEEDRLAEACRG